jgi:hypothetical protein
MNMSTIRLELLLQALTLLGTLYLNFAYRPMPSLLHLLLLLLLVPLVAV